MKRYFEYQDSKSYKFWQISLEQTICTIHYGKIGSAGQEKLSNFESHEQAEAEVNKLIKEKIKKGYQEKFAASDKKISKRLSVSYEEAENGKTLLDKMTAFLASPQAAEVVNLVIGSWEEAYENCPQAALDLLTSQSHKLPALKELFIADMDSEDCEISWIIHGDYNALLNALPNLERLHIKGSNCLSLSNPPQPALKLPQLKALTIECGGLPKSIIDSILAAELPNLEYLCLYLGVEDYGFDASLADLRPFMELGRFPKLRYLGLADSEIADDIAVAIAEAPILDQLEVLDLSKGTLSDIGAAALLASPKVLQLKRLDLHHHYISNELVKRLKALNLVVDVSEQQDADDYDWRYPAVTE